MNPSGWTQEPLKPPPYAQHWGADVVTSTYKQGSTMRDMPYPPGLTGSYFATYISCDASESGSNTKVPDLPFSDIFKARLNLFYAFCQILAIVGCFLFGFDGAFLVPNRILLHLHWIASSASAWLHKIHIDCSWPSTL
jgi:hypothetical protein